MACRWIGLAPAVFRAVPHELTVRNHTSRRKAIVCEAMENNCSFAWPCPVSYVPRLYHSLSFQWREDEGKRPENYKRHLRDRAARQGETSKGVDKVLWRTRRRV